MRRYCKPDGMCLHCGQPANQHHPVGPITVTTPDEDDAPQTGNASVTGPWRRPVAPSSSRTEPRREKR